MRRRNRGGRIARPCFGEPQFGVVDLGRKQADPKFAQSPRASGGSGKKRGSTESGTGGEPENREVSEGAAPSPPAAGRRKPARRNLASAVSPATRLHGSTTAQSHRARLLPLAGCTALPPVYLTASRSFPESALGHGWASPSGRHRLPVRPFAIAESSSIPPWLPDSATPNDLRRQLNVMKMFCSYI
ncbi:uncharacterized protein LOC104582845 [Brachypodium distachyon]|uniref:uncharacterized protein LOC104582845 n=1 Tax=Brachypodium distachyon TaxID=15368 RepID=UPI000D0CC5BA|nr:uncharacterized protein LOC104582845 [Brachypodium distachyon]|eukprot:XP_024315942.1 uncharacterized protein LOC104582845 [Brachypodium distachyon]